MDLGVADLLGIERDPMRRHVLSRPPVLHCRPLVGEQRTAHKVEDSLDAGVGPIPVHGD